MNKHVFPFQIEINRKKLDIAERRALSAEAIDYLWQQMFPDTLKAALLESIANGIEMPRSIIVVGSITVGDE